jgi:hypothetical protein
VGVVGGEGEYRWAVDGGHDGIGDGKMADAEGVIVRRMTREEVDLAVAGRRRRGGTRTERRGVLLRGDPKASLSPSGPASQ